ncbi:MAG TPA: hypothetical protein VHC01_01005 [Gaiellaceae bacterium]|jgi:hypothetical protein|nr:hypothetical protein [Gaiellaceae bacterium]
MHGRHHHRHGHGRGRRGYPTPEQWAERLQAYRTHLEAELKNVNELIGRLGEPEQPQTF